MELKIGHLKIMLAIALGVILFLLLRPVNPGPNKNDLIVAKANAREDSLKNAITDLNFALTLSRKNEAYLRKRDAQWNDTLARERKQNRATAAALTRKIVPVQRTPQESDSILSLRYKVPVHVDPPEVAETMVTEVQILDSAMAFIPREEREIEHLNKAAMVKDSLITELSSRDSTNTKKIENLTEQVAAADTSKDALMKENKKLKRGEKFWKGLAKVTTAVAVTFGIILAIQ